MAGPRNQYGVNDMADCYRTVKGVRYIWHPAKPERIAAYRKAGVRCRLFRIDGYPEIFLHPEDDQLASEVDCAGEQP